MRRKVVEIADSLKPANLLKNLVSQLIHGADVRTNMLRMAGGLVTSFLVKKFFRKRIHAKS